MKTPAQSNDNRPNDTKRSSSSHDTVGEERNLQRLTQALDRAVEHLDVPTQHALQRARQRALASQQQHASHTKQWWAGGGLITAAAALALAIHLGPKGQQGLPDARPLSPFAGGTGSEHSLSDLELLTHDEFLLLDEDLEFYAWLENELDSTI